MDTQRAITRIILSNAPFWAAEYAVSYYYFTEGHRTAEKDVAWLRLQMYKEWTGAGVYPDRSITSLANHAVSLLSRLEKEDNSVDLGAISYYLRFALDEYLHYTLLHEAYHCLDPFSKDSILSMGDLKEARNLELARDNCRKKRMGPYIVAITEGGGLGMYYGVRSALTDIGIHTALDEKIYEFSLKTINDEQSHVLYRVRDLMTAKPQPHDLPNIDEELKILFNLKMIERNAQFGNVFSADELTQRANDISAGRRYITEYLQFLLDGIETFYLPDRTQNSTLRKASDI